MKWYVVDASVIIKWVLGDESEPDQEKALNLLDAWVNGTVELSAPTLWQYEVGNFLGRELHQDASEKMKLLLNLDIKSVDLTSAMFDRCFVWMRQKGITFYDASYLAVAAETGADLVTADKKFTNRMREKDRICLLNDLDMGSDSRY